MITVKDNKSLNEAIAFLENQQQSDLYLLKEHFEFTKEQLNPIRIIKDGFSDAVSAPNFKGKLVKGVLGLASGFLAKKFVIGSGAGIIGKLAGTALQTGVSGLVMKAPENLDGIKEGGISLLQKGLKKLKIK
jgi:hypothetical protein